jgi:hypothetical protein
MRADGDGSAAEHEAVGARGASKTLEAPIGSFGRARIGSSVRSQRDQRGPSDRAGAEGNVPGVVEYGAIGCRVSLAVDVCGRSHETDYASGSVRPVASRAINKEPPSPPVKPIRGVRAATTQAADVASRATRIRTSSTRVRSLSVSSVACRSARVGGKDAERSRDCVGKFLQTFAQLDAPRGAAAAEQSPSALQCLCELPDGL